MSTSFLDKCKILAEVYTESSWNEELTEFRYTNDIGLPLAYLVNQDLTTANDKGEMFIESTWEDLCLYLRVDHKKKYSSSDEMIEESTKNLKELEEKKDE
jgi:hypothetical protein